MIDKKIEIVSSSIRMYSMASQEHLQNILSVLKDYAKDVRITFIDKPEDLHVLVTRKPDLIFLRMDYIPLNIKESHIKQNNIWISDVLESNNIEYTGSLKEARIFSRYKNISKQRILDLNINTAPFYITNIKTYQKSTEYLKYPLFVKPNDKGGGLGINDKSIVYNIVELQRKIKENYKLYLTDSLVEEYLPGREFTVTLLKLNNSTKYNIMPIELIAPKNKNGDRILGSKIKKADTESSKIVPEGELKNKISELAYKSFCAIGGRDYGRIDIRLDKNGVPNFLEANLFPSLVKDFGNFPKACKTFLGYSYEQTILHITNLGMQRVNNQNNSQMVKQKISEGSFEPSLI